MRPTESQPPLLSVEGFAVAAGGVPLLEGVGLTLGPGEILGLTGPSGCGKTTLLRAVAGLIDAARGQVRFNAKPRETLGWPQYRRRVVLVDQRPALIDDTVKANLARPFEYRTAQTPFPLARAGELLQRTGLDPERLGQAARSLSVGQQQRVSLVRALLLDPAALLLDEPTGALDEDSVSAVEGLIREEAHRNRIGVLIVTHDKALATRLCDRQIDLKNHAVSKTAGSVP